MRWSNRAKTHTRLIVSTIFFHNLKLKGEIKMAQFNVKEFVQGNVSLVNHVDGSPIEATFANEQFSSADESVATVNVDPADGPDTAVLDIVGVSVGETDITVTVDASYTDPNTNESLTKSKSVTIQVTITEPVEQAETDLIVNLGTPQPVSTAEEQQ